MKVLTQLALIRPLVKRFGERTLLLIGQASIAIAYFGLAASASAIIATLLLAPYGFGFGVSEPSMQSLVTRFGQRQARGYLLGLYQSSRSLAFIVGPILAGYVYQNISPRSVFDLAGVVIGLGFIAGLVLKRLEIVPIPVDGY